MPSSLHTYTGAAHIDVFRGTLPLCSKRRFMWRLSSNVSKGKFYDNAAFTHLIFLHT